MSTLRYALKKLAGLLLVLLVTSFLVFGLLYLAPGTPLSFILGPRGGTPEQIAAVTAKYHLDDPFPVRYLAWLGDVLHGDFGQSIVYRQDVSGMISGRVGTTVALVLLSALIITVAGIGWGTFAALKPGRIGGTISALASAALSTPVFVIGVALISLFAVALNWFPVFGSGDGGWDTLRHLALPALALSFGSTAYLVRITRAAVEEEGAREHVQTAVARALPRRTIIGRHILRNAMVPVTTVLGLTVASLVAGSVVVENVFAIDGLGSLLVKAILQRDFAVVQAVVLVLVLGFVVINAVVDILYTFIDPRISMGRKP
ncbi:ABC transporter permease [Arthrobacter sp. NPDC090010]|uniref:ABC transporter permease n=1 Tax=Arthrobacter sp. NPDC090010 TaxID=3363942 RepID=UPI0037F7669E